MQKAYIQSMMLRILFALFMIQVQTENTAGFPQLIVDLDREISGLLDAYLEAVPECPVLADTPLRLWVIDLAWLRTEAAIEKLSTLDPGQMLSDSGIQQWMLFLEATNEYFQVFSEIQRMYHEPSLPDGAVCIDLEDRLLQADSLWRHSEMNLFELFAEEDIL